MANEFPIGTVPLPNGGRIGISGLPGLNNPLADDVRAICNWKPDHVVSMTEQVEMDVVGCGKLGSILHSATINWIHLPIRDFGGLTDDNLSRWPAISSRLHHCLELGGGVLLHCRGGQGRSGMIALRLLVERGEQAEAALIKLRQVRPGAVETDEQFIWASQRH